MSNQTVCITCGIVGSGKSTWTKHCVSKEDNYIIVSKDHIRNMLKYEYIFDKNLEPLVKKITSSAIVNAIQEGYNVIIDETNITKSTRKYWLDVVESAGIHNVQSIILIFPEVEKNLENRMKDPRTYTKAQWAVVIENMKEHFELPNISEDKRITSVKEVTLLENKQYVYSINL